MPVAVLAVGLLILVLGVRGQSNAAGQLLASEFTGKNSYIQWFLAVMILGVAGYYKPVRPVADGMLGLVVVAIIIAKGNPKNSGGGLFYQLEQAFQNTTATPVNAVTPGEAAVQNLFTQAPTTQSTTMSGVTAFATPAAVDPIAAATTSTPFNLQDFIQPQSALPSPLSGITSFSAFGDTANDT